MARGAQLAGLQGEDERSSATKFWGSASQGPGVNVIPLTRSSNMCA